jgi:hypothetical protein
VKILSCPEFLAATHKKDAGENLLRPFILIEAMPQKTYSSKKPLPSREKFAGVSDEPSPACSVVKAGEPDKRLKVLISIVSTTGEI